MAQHCRIREDLNAETLNNKGVVLYDQGKYDEAVKAFDKAIEINPQYEAAWIGKGMTLGSQGKYDEAVKAFDKAIEINPQHADAWAGKGFALQLLGQTDKADAAFAKVKELGFSDAGGSWLLLKPLGAIVQVNATPEKILEVQFNASSVEKHDDSYILTVPGRLKATLPDDLGYSGANAVKMDNVTKVTIIATPETVITNYLKKNLDADVKIVGVAPVLYEIRTNVTRESLDALLAPVGGKVPTGEDTFVAGVTVETMDEAKTVLDSKLNRLGLQDIRVESRR